MSSEFRGWETGASLEEVREGMADWMRNGDARAFEERALALFRWQALHNPVYAEFVAALGMEPRDVLTLEAIPFLPVEMFKSHEIKSGHWQTARVFRSSGTTASTTRAQHFMDSSGLDWYRDVARLAWSDLWDAPVDHWTWLGLLPGYLGREDASLLTMVSDFMNEADGHSEGMLMHKHTALKEQILSWSQSSTRPLVLFGVTWAILDWMEELHKDNSWLASIPWEKVTLVETGGMKGRGIEPIREEVHAEIRQRLPEIQIASEYGMTEMMSQGYAQDGVHHRFPKWVRPVVREPRDPRSPGLKDRVGRLDIVDLANVHSCAFLATGDAANHTDDGLVLLGRQDESEVRGCSLLATP